MMNDEAATLNRIAGQVQKIRVIADTISCFISSSWKRGDRNLCADCMEIRGAVDFGPQGAAGKCDGCGDDEWAIYQWEVEDISGMALEYIKLAEWHDNRYGRN